MHTYSWTLTVNAQNCRALKQRVFFRMQPSLAAKKLTCEPSLKFLRDRGVANYNICGLQIQCIYQANFQADNIIISNNTNVNVEGRPIEQISNFTYMGAVISGNRTIDKRLSSRIQKASGAFYQLSSIWNSRNIRTPMKVRVYKAAILTILLYGSEVWNTIQTQMKRFEVFHQRCLRRILKIKWNYFVSNAEVLNRANIAPVDVFIRAARLRWFSHVVRMPG